MLGYVSVFLEEEDLWEGEEEVRGGGARQAEKAVCRFWLVMKTSTLV